MSEKLFTANIDGTAVVEQYEREHIAPSTKKKTEFNP